MVTPVAEITRDKIMNVSTLALYETITDFAAYPKFLPEVVSARLLPGGNETKQKVEFEIEVVKRFQYTLEFKMTPQNKVSWDLLESNFFKTNRGVWDLKQDGDLKTSVKYQLEVGFGFLVPGWITKKLTEVNLPKMFDSFEARAKSLTK